MKPPICYICFATLNTKKVFKLIKFRQEKNQQNYPPGHVGHPINQVWFCSNHSNYAEKLSYLPFSKARKIIKNKRIR